MLFLVWRTSESTILSFFFALHALFRTKLPALDAIDNMEGSHRTLSRFEKALLLFLIQFQPKFLAQGIEREIH